MEAGSGELQLLHVQHTTDRAMIQRMLPAYGASVSHDQPAGTEGRATTATPNGRAVAEGSRWRVEACFYCLYLFSLAMQGVFPGASCS